MAKKLTILVDDEVYDGLYARIGPRRIGHFIQELVRPYVVGADLDAEYREMAADLEREAEALEWAEGTLDDDFEAR